MMHPSRGPSLALALALCAAVVLGPRGATADEIGGPGVINRGTIGGNVNVGATPEQIEVLIRAATQPLERLDTELRAEVSGLAARLNVTEPAVRNMLRVLGEREVPPERLVGKLAEIAERHRELERRLAALEPEDPVVRGLLEDAGAAVEGGEYDRAERLLEEAEGTDLAAVRMADELARQAQEAADKRRLSAAATRAERGELALVRLDYRTTAEHFARAAGLVPDSRGDARAGYLEGRARALYRQGEEKGDNAALVEAVALGRDLLEVVAHVLDGDVAGRIHLVGADPERLGADVGGDGHWGEGEGRRGRKGGEEDER